MFRTGIEPPPIAVISKHTDGYAIRQTGRISRLYFVSAKKAPAKTVEVPADLGTLQSEYDELKKDQDDLLELLSDQQLKIGIGFELHPQNPRTFVRGGLVRIL